MQRHEPRFDSADGAQGAVAAPPVQAWCLRFLSGAVKGRTIALRPGPNVGGASGECDVMLPGSDVLPRHLVLHVGELVVALQRVGTAAVRLNGEPVVQARKSLVAGDAVGVGSIEFQLDRNYAPAPRDDRMFAPGAAALQYPGAGQADAGRAPRRVLLAGLAVLALMGALALGALLSGGGAGGVAPVAGLVNLGEVERALVPFPEVEVVALAGGQFSVKGYVESRERRAALQEAMAPFGRKVTVGAHAADDMVEQARRYVGDPGVAVTYAGQGRLVFSGSVEDGSVRQKIRRLSEDLHPSVLVTDRVIYREKAAAAAPPAPDLRAQWDGWQSVLPARLVSITEDGTGLRHIQLANGSRYYEGSLMRSGAQLQRIGADGLVLTGGDRPPAGGEGKR